MTNQPHGEVLTEHQWRAALAEVQASETELRGHVQAVNLERRTLPGIDFDTGYGFEGPDGSRTLLDLFDGRRQLIVYHFWFEPGEEPCPGCSMWTRNLGGVADLNNNDTTLVFVSRAPVDEIESTRNHRGWTVPWYSQVSDQFNAAVGYQDVAQLSVFTRDNHSVLLTYINREGADLQRLTNHWTLLELTPAGR